MPRRSVTGGTPACVSNHWRQGLVYIVVNVAVVLSLSAAHGVASRKSILIAGGGAVGGDDPAASGRTEVSVDDPFVSRRTDVVEPDRSHFRRGRQVHDLHEGSAAHHVLHPRPVSGHHDDDGFLPFLARTTSDTDNIANGEGTPPSVLAIGQSTHSSTCMVDAVRIVSMARPLIAAAARQRDTLPLTVGRLVKGGMAAVVAEGDEFGERVGRDLSNSLLVHGNASPHLLPSPVEGRLLVETQARRTAAVVGQARETARPQRLVRRSPGRGAPWLRLGVRLRLRADADRSSERQIRRPF
mmetsp:Transcript_14114/g.40163  ORF Transcript_14114/g.40163 Transcript_14114/m.40163 type:complete len:298 (-) Transcript_14114:345-1238(-)